MSPCSQNQLSANFRRQEFACRCGCGFDTVDAVLVCVLQDVRSHFDKPVHLLSGCRCEAHNKATGGVENSRHEKGQAGDIVVRHVGSDDVAKYLNERYPDSLGIGWYPGWTHVDVRSEKARWGS